MKRYLIRASLAVASLAALSSFCSAAPKAKGSTNAAAIRNLPPAPLTVAVDKSVRLGKPLSGGPYGTDYRLVVIRTMKSGAITRQTFFITEENLPVLEGSCFAIKMDLSRGAVFVNSPHGGYQMVSQAGKLSQGFPVDESEIFIMPLPHLAKCQPPPCREEYREETEIIVDPRPIPDQASVAPPSKVPHREIRPSSEQEFYYLPRAISPTPIPRSKTESGGILDPPTQSPPPFEPTRPLRPGESYE